MFSVSGSKAFCRFIIRVAFIPLIPSLSLPMVCHADVGLYGHQSNLLSLQSAMSQQWIPPVANIEADVTRQSRSRPIISAPEPYSFLLATFGAFGVLAMATLFRRRIKSEQQPADPKRFRVRDAKYTKYKRHHISVVGRNR